MEAWFAGCAVLNFGCFLWNLSVKGSSAIIVASLVTAACCVALAVAS